MKERSGQKVQLSSLDSLLGGSLAEQTMEAKLTAEDGQVVKMKLNKILPFQGHPFRVCDDAKMAETVSSIEKYGVLVPGIVRPHKTHPGMYEQIAGHRRNRGAKLAGLDEMPVIIKNLSDDEATIIMVDSNIQREDLLYSEKAWAYRMKYDALKRLGAGEGVRSDSVLAKEAGESRNTIQRYIRLTYLIPELLQRVDDGKLPWNTAADGISYLRESEQQMLLKLMIELQVTPSGEQAKKLKEFSKDNSLVESVMRFVLERKDDLAKVNLSSKKIRGYFPESYTGKQIEDVIFSLLAEWKERGLNTVV